MAAWGTLGATLEIEGASGRVWNLRFERRLAPRESAAIANPASSVWLVREESDSTFYAAKRQALASLTEVDALVDEAAAWRSACLADQNTHVVELLDVFVQRSAPFSVTFLAEFCSRGLLPRRNLSEPVLLTMIADLSTAAAAIPSPHAHITYDSLFLDDNGFIRLAGFGAHRSAILRDNPGLTPSDDSFDIGLLLYELVFGSAPPDDLSIPDNSRYSHAIIDLIQHAFSHPHPQQLCDAALAAGAELRAPIVDPDKKRTADASTEVAPTHVVNATERNVDRLIEGVDIGPTFSALLSDLNADPDAVATSIFKALFKKPMSKNPLSAVRAFTMLHNLMLDGPEAILASIRKNDKFMEWSESSWSQNVIEGIKDDEDVNPAIQYFAAGELSFYAAFLRRKARFHQLAAGSLSGRWDRTGVVDADGKDALVSRKRKVLLGMADLIEMASELGCLFAAASDPQTPVKHAGLGAMVSDCCLAYNAALEMAHDSQNIAVVKKLVPGFERIYAAARTLVLAVVSVPSAGGDAWAEQFDRDEPPDIVAAVVVNLKKSDNAEKKKKKSSRNKSKKEAPKPPKVKGKSKMNAAEDEITAADGALVVHGEDTGSKAAKAMFGDLLRIEDEPVNVDHEVRDVRPVDGMSNAQALASAFGVSENTLAESYEDRQNGDGEDDYDGEGGFEDYQARQGGNSDRGRASRGPSTAAWAAKAGYGARALVNSKPSQVAVSEDSLDAEDGNGDAWHGRNERNDSYQERRRYQDDYDSYESVSYTVEDDHGRMGYEEDRSANSAIPLGGAEHGDYSGPAAFGNSAMKPFVLSRKQEINMKKLRVGDKISDGDLIVVHQGEYNREAVAVKKLTKKGIVSPEAIREFSNEVEVMCTLSHPHVMKCTVAGLKSPNFVLVTEMMKRGTLFNVLYKSRIKLTWALIRKMALQLAQGMDHMHSNGYLHRDLKSLNIFTDGGYNVKVGDFGLSCHVSESQGKGISGTYQYMAPEVLEGGPHTFHSDVYSFALVLTEMVSGALPFHGLEPRDVAERVVSENLRPTIPATCQRSYVDIIKKCWASDPSVRPSFSEVIELINAAK